MLSLKKRQGWNPFIRHLPGNVLLTLLCFLCYGSSLDGEFVFDDRPAILENPVVKNQPLDILNLMRSDYWGTPLNSTTSHKSYRPLITLMFHLEQGFKLTPFAMKLVNLILHVINVNLLRFLLLYLCEPDSEVSLLAATLFAIHPIHTETVCGIVSRADLVAAILYISGVLISLMTTGSQEHCNLGSLIVILLTAVGLLAKEIIITLPLICLILDFLRELQCEGVSSFTPFFECLWRFGHRLKTILYIMSIVSLSWIRCWQMEFRAPKFQPMDNPVAHSDSWQTRFLSQQYLYIRNLQIMLLPTTLSFDWSFGCIKLVEDWFDPRLTPLLLVYGVLAIAFYQYRHNLPALYGVVLCIVPYLPASGLLVRVGFVIAERLLYLPAIGFCYLVALGFCQLYSIFEGKTYWRTILGISVGVLVIVLSLRCHQRALEWKTEKILFKSALKVCPNNAKVHYNIAKLSSDEKNYSLALRHYHRAISLQPDYEAALMNLGNLYRVLGDFLKAEEYLQRLVNLSPKYAAAWMNLGILYTNTGNDNRAFFCYREALKLRPKYANCHYNLANLHLKRNEAMEAIQHWQKAITLKPNLHQAWINLLTMLDGREMFSEVLHVSQKAMELLPFNAAILMVRANVFGKLKEYQKAEQVYEYILEREPLNDMVHVNIGVLYHRWGKREKAIHHYSKAIDLQSVPGKVQKESTASRNLRQLLRKIG